MGSHCKTTIQNQCNPSPLSAHTFLVGPLKVLWCSHPVLQGHHQPGNGHSLLLRECCLFLPPLHHSHLPHTPSLPLPLHKHLRLFKHLCFHIEVISRHLNNKCTYVAIMMVIRVWSENPSLFAEQQCHPYPLLVALTPSPHFQLPIPHICQPPAPR